MEGSITTFLKNLTKQFFSTTMQKNMSKVKVKKMLVTEFEAQEKGNIDYC